MRVVLFRQTDTQTATPVRGYPVPMERMADRMRAARVLADLSQQELADRLGISIGTVKRREYGHGSVSAENLMALAQSTGVPLAWLVCGFSDEQINEPLDVSLERLRSQPAEDVTLDAERPPLPKQ